MSDRHAPADPQPPPESGECLWFLNTLVRIRISFTEGPDRLSAIEHRVPFGDSPPLHSHASEDELFHILDGEFRFQLGDTDQRVGAGAMLLVPKGAIHSYRAESPEGGRFVTVTSGSEFETFVRAAGRPAGGLELPPPSGPPTAEAMAALTEIAAAHGIVFHGPPLR